MPHRGIWQRDCSQDHQMMDTLQADNSHMMSSIRRKGLSHRWLLFTGLCAILLSSGLRAVGAQPALRVAIGQFFAPPANGGLKTSAAALSDLLMVELSHQDRFQLVERDKVNAIWNEFHLTAAGLTASDTVARLGRVLACDWLVTGSLISTESGLQVWTKIIDVSSGVALDMKAVPYDANNLSATISGISEFISRSSSHPQPQPLIALGTFTDMSISTSREDLSRKLPALIEKHFRASGVSVAEREAIAPIFEEFQFQRSGLMGSATNRVQLRPVFWLVDGACKWVRDTEDKVSVALRIQRVGGQEEVFRITKPPGTELEQAIIQTIQTALASTNQIPSEQAATSEATLQSERGILLANRKGPSEQERFTSNLGSIEEQKRKFFEQQQAARHAALASFERALLLNPKDLQAKYMLGYGLLFDREPAPRERGKQFLREVVAANDPKLSAQAKIHLTNADIYLQQIIDPSAGSVVVANRANLSPLAVSTASIGASPPVVPAIVRAINSPATNAPFLLGHPIPLFGGPASMTAAYWGGNELLIAGGTKLYRLNTDISQMEKVDPPIEITHPIRAISLSIDPDYWWLGTEGQGLIRIDKSGGKPVRVFSEKDGLLMPTIKSTGWLKDRLWLGFGFRSTGGLGYLDTRTEKFVGLTGETPAFKTSAQQIHEPPTTAVTSIKSADGKTLWVASTSALHRFDIASQKWDVALGSAPFCVSVTTNMIAIGAPTGGVMVCSLADGQWRTIDLPATSPYSKIIVAIRFDEEHPRWLWVGTAKEVLLIDAMTRQILAICNIAPLNNVRWIAVGPKSVMFVAGGLYMIPKSWLPDALVASHPVTAN